MASKIRFGVKAVDGRTTNVWICWTLPRKGDVYLTSDVLGQILKLSNHPTGRSHIAYHYEKRDELFTPESLPNDRFILKREGAQRAQEPWYLVATIFFPSGSPADVPRDGPTDTIWLPEAPAGQATEVGVFRLNSAALMGTWPGKNDGAVHLADLPLEASARLSIVWRHSAFNMPAPPNTASPNLFRDRTEEELLQANRMVIFGTTESGAYSLIETSVKMRRSAGN